MDARIIKSTIEWLFAWNGWQMVRRGVTLSTVTEAVDYPQDHRPVYRTYLDYRADLAGRPIFTLVDRRMALNFDKPGRN